MDDTLGGAYPQKFPILAASAAETAAVRKTEKYWSFEQSYHFVPVTMETLAPICEGAHEFIEEIGHKITDITSDPRETPSMLKRLSVAVQRFAAICLSETF